MDESVSHPQDWFPIISRTNSTSSALCRKCHGPGSEAAQRQFVRGQGLWIPQNQGVSHEVCGETPRSHLGSGEIWGDLAAGKPWDYHRNGVIIQQSAPKNYPKWPESPASWATIVGDLVKTEVANGNFPGSDALEDCGGLMEVWRLHIWWVPSRHHWTIGWFGLLPNVKTC